MSATVDTVQLFNPPVAHNTICFMTSAVNAAFAVSYFFLKQLSPNSGHYYRLTKLSRHNPPPPTAQHRAEAEPHHAGMWGQQLPVAPSCSSAPSQQHQARASRMWVLIPHNSSSMHYFQDAFQSIWKENAFPHTPHYWLVTQRVNYYAQFNKKLNKWCCCPHSNNLYISSWFTRKMWLNCSWASPTWAQHSSSLGSLLLLQSTASSLF